MIDEHLVELAGPVGRCSSTAAVEVARTLAVQRDRAALMHRVVSGEGLYDDASSTRWEVRFDLPDAVAVLDIVVTFTWDEDRRRFGGGIASITQTPFPSPGSELERMAVGKALTRRRVRAIWRQTLAGHRHLPAVIPDASEAVRVVRSRDLPLGELRSVEASVPRSEGPCWVVSGSQGRHRVRWSTARDGVHALQV